MVNHVFGSKIHLNRSMGDVPSKGRKTQDFVHSVEEEVFKDLKANDDVKLVGSNSRRYLGSYIALFECMGYLDEYLEERNEREQIREYLKKVEKDKETIYESFEEKLGKDRENFEHKYSA